MSSIHLYFTNLLCHYSVCTQHSGVKTKEVFLAATKQLQEHLLLSVRLTVCLSLCHTFYASAFRRRRHYVFGLSVRSSVQSLKYPLSTCAWVRQSIRPAMTVLLHVRPSGEVSRYLLENTWREWLEIWHADVSWPPSARWQYTGLAGGFSRVQGPAAYVALWRHWQLP